MRKIIYSTKINNNDYSLYLSDEEEFLRTCLKKRIPAVALIPGSGDLANTSRKPSSDLGFFPWAAEDESSLSEDKVYMDNIIFRTCGIPKTVCITQRLLIRELCENDAHSVLSLFEEGAESGFVSPWKSSPEETAIELRDYNRYYYDMYEYGYFGIELRDEFRDGSSLAGMLIGVAGFSGISDLNLSTKRNDRHNTCHIIKKSTPGPDPSPLEAGYLISSSYRMKGYAYEAMTALLGCSFSRCHDVYIFTDKKNIAGNHLSSKLTG